MNVNSFFSPITLTHSVKARPYCSWSPWGDKDSRTHSLPPQAVLHPVDEGWGRIPGEKSLQGVISHPAPPQFGDREESLQTLPGAAPQSSLFPLSSPALTLLFSLGTVIPSGAPASGQPLSSSPCCHPKPPGLHIPLLLSTDKLTACAGTCGSSPASLSPPGNPYHLFPVAPSFPTQ